MTFENLRLEISDRIATVTVNREQALNVLNATTLAELGALFAEIGRDSSIGAAIITGAGEKAFVAGADIREMSRLDATGACAFSRRFHQTLDLIDQLGKPVVAAINGFALGGGCELALACHLRIASGVARLGQPEVKLGIIAGAGGTQRLARLVGRGPALEMLLLGDPLSAEEACRIGLVNRVVAPSELMPVCRALLGRMLANAPLALRCTMEAVRSGMEMSLQEGLALESSLFGLCFASEDMREGMRAFLEKRPADFRGK